MPLTQPRRALLNRLFPEGIPTLWCPPLVHYDRHGNLDPKRISAHLAQIANWADGLLLLGSTGDGWDMTDADRERYLQIALDCMAHLPVRLLVGVLKRTPQEMLHTLEDSLAWLQCRLGATDLQDCLGRRRICGFVLCPPAGDTLSQEDIERDLEPLLGTGVPVALYQLPQVTRNEMGPELVARLARQHANFILFKDSSGTDRVALTSPRPSAVPLLRGAEGDYHRWLKTAGGPYDGFLLSSANCFGAQLRHVLRDVEKGRMPDAQALSDRLTRTLGSVFNLVRDVPVGNAFTNANKAIDHFMAHGPRAAQVRPPTLYGGCCLPTEALEQTAEVLRQHDLMPAKGYLE